MTMKAGLIFLVPLALALGCAPSEKHDHDHEPAVYVRPTDEADKKAGIEALSPSDGVSLETTSESHGDHREVSGTLKNTSDKRLEEVRVYVNIVDKDNKVLEVLKPTTAAVEPGGEWKFKVESTKPGAASFAVVEIRARKVAKKA